MTAEGKGGALRRPTLGPEDSSAADVRAELIVPEEGSSRTADSRPGADPAGNWLLCPGLKGISGGSMDFRETLRSARKE
jgi:hypothetical protein